MTSGNVFKDNGYTYGSGDVFNDAGQNLIAATNFYVSTSGKATWVTHLLVYGAGAMVGGTVKLLLYIPANDLAATGNAATNLTDAIDVTLVSGWNTVTLPTPRALPIYSGAGAVQKFTVGLYNGVAANYVARDPVGGTTVPSALSGLFYSASSDSNNPTSRGSFKYGAWPSPAGAQGAFNLWNGTDVQVTDVNPGGGAANYTASPADAAGITDSATDVVGAVRSAADPIGATDAVARVLAAVRAASDVVGVTDSVTALRTTARTAGDPVGISDSAASIVTTGRALPDQVGVTDSVIVQLDVVGDKTATPADSIGVTDAVAVVMSRIITLADFIAATDAVSSPLGRISNPADPVAIADAVAATSAAVRGADDPVGIVDAVSVSLDRAVSIGDAVGVVDAVLGQTNLIDRDINLRAHPLPDRFTVTPHQLELAASPLGGRWSTIPEEP